MTPGLPVLFEPVYTLAINLRMHELEKKEKGYIWD